MLVSVLEKKRGLVLCCDNKICHNKLYNISLCWTRNIIGFCRFGVLFGFFRPCSYLWRENAGWLTLCLPIGGWKRVHQRALSNRKTAGAVSCTSGRWKSGCGSGWSHRGAQWGGDLHTEMCLELDRHTSGHGWDHHSGCFPRRAGVVCHPQRMESHSWLSQTVVDGVIYSQFPFSELEECLRSLKIGYSGFCRKPDIAPEREK